MTREHKLSLILGFAVVLVVGVLISDHLSGARKATLDTGDPGRLIDHIAQQPASSSGLTLLDDFGRPIVAPASNGVHGSPEPAAAQLDSDWFGEQVASTLRELGQGTGLPIAAQTNDVVPAGVPTIDMGRAYRESIKSAPDMKQMPPFLLHVVADGESLWSIAQRYLGNGSRYPEIEAINKDRLPSGRSLRAGVSIRVPDISKTASSKPAVLVDPPNEQDSAPAKSGESTTYTVKKGDTLSEIAQDLLGTIRRMDEIIAANSRLSSADDLQVGMVLKIPAK